MTDPYITGITALCIPQKGRVKAFWYGIGAPETWTVAGRNSTDTSDFFGEHELVDLLGRYLAEKPPD